MPSISVIVPVYKVEQYLPACVGSILAQTFSDFELILVDDGSPDNCGAMCDAYAEQDPRVRVIHQENGGLSAARNSGIDIAQGEYITFVDSDDLITPQFLNCLYQTAKVQNAEIVTSWFIPFSNEKTLKTSVKLADKPIIIHCGEDAVRILYEGNDIVTVNACAKLISRNLIGELRFPLGRLHEDQAFIPIVCYRAKKVVSYHTPLYFYRSRPDSITAKPFSTDRFDDLWAIGTCIDFFSMEGKPEIVAVAQEEQMRMRCVYSIEAEANGVQISPEYKVGKHKALRYLKKHVSEDRYEYCLSKASPMKYHIYLYGKRFRRAKIRFFDLLKR